MATILIIDDEHSIRTLLRDVLEQGGHKVLEAKDGREGVTVYQSNSVDLVIMDLLMPDTDGLEATLQLTREYVDAKIIAMTGAQGERNFLDVAKMFGARRTFEKPVEIKQMLQAVQQDLAS
ncbi:MAG: response regulator, partial [Nitrospiraceae bacterium]